MIWQIGLPAKPFFDTAYSTPNAIMTDTALPYPVNNVSSLILSNIDTGTFHAVHGINTLTFLHKYQTTQYHDGCAVEVSYNGTSWQNFLVDTFWQNHSELGSMGQPFSNGMYTTSDTLFNGTYGFSGTSSGWVYSQIEWIWWMAVRRSDSIYVPDSMFIRFTFYSDSTSESLDGWLIDNISLTGQDPSGISETIFQSSAVVFFPQPCHNKVNVVSRKGIRPESYTIYDMTGRKISGGIAANNFFVDVSEIPPGIYEMAIETDEKNFLVKPLLVTR